MKQLKLPKRFQYGLLLFITTFLFYSCGTALQMMETEKNARKLELGMSKQQMIHLMGKNYMALEAGHYYEGATEILGYPDAGGGMYKIKLVNGFVAGWVYEPPKPEHTHKEHNH